MYPELVKRASDLAGEPTEDIVEQH